MKFTEGRLRLSASDVANFLACQQLTQLDLQAARGERRPTRDYDIGFQDLVRRDEEHELTVLNQFLAQGHEVADLTHAEDPPGATKAAIQAGTEVIYQATLTAQGEHPCWDARTSWSAPTSSRPATATRAPPHRTTR